MTDHSNFDDYYEPPTEEFIRNSLLYGLNSENSEKFDDYVTRTIGYGYSDFNNLIQKRGKLTRILITFAFKNKDYIKRIPLIGRLALIIKQEMARRNYLGENPFLPRLDLSEIMSLDVNEFIRQLYALALGRSPDIEGMENCKRMLCSGATKEAVVYIVCTSKEFAGRAKVANLDQYRKAFWRYRIRSSLRKIPVLGWIWAVAAMPIRIFRLEVDERLRHVDRTSIERQQIELLVSQSNTLIEQYKNLNSSTEKIYVSLSAEIENLLLKNHELEIQIKNINAEYSRKIKQITSLIKAEDSYLNSSNLPGIGASLKSNSQSLQEIISALNSSNLPGIGASLNSNSQNLQEIISALQVANQNIIHANVKLDETGGLIINTANRFKPIFYGLPGGITAIQTNKFIIGVPSEEWRLAVFLSLNGSFEPGTEKYFCSIIKEGMNVLDIGANLGIYTLHGLAAGCHVYSYEPTPKIFNILLDNIGINGFDPSGRAHPYNLAVSDREGEIEFAIYDNFNGQNNTIYPINIDDKTIKIETVYLDKHLEHLPHIDVVKIDVEGAEPLVLKGMHEIIIKNPEIKIIMEFAPRHLLRGGTNPSDFINTIHKMGFDILLIDGTSGVISEISEGELCSAFSVNVLLTKSK